MQTLLKTILIPAVALIPFIVSALPTVTLNTNAPEMDENRVGQVSIILDTGGVIEDSVEILLQFAGTAEASTDYVTIPQSVTIPQEGTLTFPIVPIDDADTENLEDIQISIVADPQYQIGTPSSVSIQIIDDESKTYGTLIKIGNSGSASFTYSWKTSDLDGCFGNYSTWSDWNNWGNCLDHEQTRARTCNDETNGTQQRIVWCERSDGVSVGDVSDIFAGCESASRPSITTTCTRGCTGDSEETQNCLSYAWNYDDWSECTGNYDTWSDFGDWSDCDADCGGGERTRTKTCNNDNLGSQTRSVWCQSNDGSGGLLTVADSYCDTGSKPDTVNPCSRGCLGNPTEEEACNTFSCATYAWQTYAWGTCGGAESTWSNWSDWSDCSVDCGIGILTRTRSCNNEANGTQTRGLWCQETTWDGGTQSQVDNSYCSGTPPSTTQNCVSGCLTGSDTETQECSNTCYTYAWEVGSWSSCTAGNYSDWNAWSGWSTCTKNCDGGTHTRTRTCSNNPRGERLRTVACMRTSNFGEVVQVNDSYCDPETEPEDDLDCVRGCLGSSSETESCNTQSCASCYTKGPGWFIVPANGEPFGCSSGLTTSPFNDCNQFANTTTTYCFQVCRNMKIEACFFINGRCRNLKNNYGYDAYWSGDMSRYLQVCTFQTP